MCVACACVCVCIHVCVHYSCCIPQFYIENNIIPFTAVFVNGIFKICTVWILLKSLCLRQLLQDCIIIRMYDIIIIIVVSQQDLAACNIMVSEDEICKVGDFGLLREIPKDADIYVSWTRPMFPIQWMAAESLIKENSPQQAMFGA